MIKKLNRDLRVVLVSALSLVVLYAGVDFLRGTDLFSSTHTYYVVYPEVKDLARANPVHINGHTVGQVYEISILQSQGYRMLVAFTVDKAIELRSSTIAELQSSGLLGGKTIGLLMEDRSGVPLRAGDTLLGQTQKTISDFLDETQVGDDIASAIKRINEILLGMEGVGELILHTLQNVDTMSSSVRQLVLMNQQSLGGIVGNLAISAREVRRATTRLDSFMLHADELMVSVDKVVLNDAITGLNESVGHMESILGSVKTRQGSVGKLLYSDSLYREVVGTLSTLQRVLNHLDSRPKDFMSPLGRSQKQIERKKRRTSAQRQQNK